MKIKVTAKHISNGTALSMCDCPVALALKQQLHKLVIVQVDQLEYMPYSHASKYCFVTRTSDTPKKVKQFIKRFDSGKRVRPFSFDVSFTDARYIW